MPKKCIVCKSESTPLCKRSFHTFPRNKLRRQEWIESMSISKSLNFKNAHLCSDHFDEDSFFYSDELRRRQRLLPEAIPRKKIAKKQSTAVGTDNCKVNEVVQENFQTNNTIKQPYAKENSTLQNISLQSPLSIKTETDIDDSFFNNSSVNLSPPSDICNENEIYSYIEVLSNDSLNEDSSNDCNTESRNSPSLNNQLSNEKRKLSFSDTKAVKKVRFIANFRTEYICREDFNNEEAWEKFLRYSAYQRSKLAAAHNRNSRKEQKIQNLKVYINNLEKEIKI